MSPLSNRYGSRRFRAASPYQAQRCLSVLEERLPMAVAFRVPPRVHVLPKISGRVNLTEIGYSEQRFRQVHHTLDNWSLIFQAQHMTVWMNHAKSQTEAVQLSLWFRMISSTHVRTCSATTSLCLIQKPCGIFLSSINMLGFQPSTGDETSEREDVVEDEAFDLRYPRASMSSLRVFWATHLSFEPQKKTRLE